MNASSIPYCVAALLGVAKASGERVAINYVLGNGIDSPLRTFVVPPLSKTVIKYGAVCVTVPGMTKGAKTSKRIIKCYRIHSMTDATGQVHPFTARDRELCSATAVWPSAAMSYRVRI